jgi:hypothetical protein
VQHRGRRAEVAQLAWDDNINGKRLGKPARSVDTREVAPTNAADRALNLAFVPRLGWRGTVFPTGFSPVMFSAVIVLWLYLFRGFRGVDATAHTVLGVVVSLLIVFRTQQALTTTNCYDCL